MVCRVPSGGSFKGYPIQMGMAGIGFSVCLGSKKPDYVFSGSIGSPTDRWSPVRFKCFGSGIDLVFFTETKRKGGNIFRPEDRVSMGHMVYGGRVVFF